MHVKHLSKVKIKKCEFIHKNIEKYQKQEIDYESNLITLKLKKWS